MPLALGRALAGVNVGGGIELGQYGGALTVALTGANIAAHTHDYAKVDVGGVFQAGAGGINVSTNTGPGNTLGGAPLTDPGTPFSILPPTAYRYILIKL